MDETIATITYWHGQLPQEWAPDFIELVDIELFCHKDHRNRAYNILLDDPDWRECLDRADLAIGPPISGEDGYVFLALKEDKGASILGGSADLCGLCEQPVP